MAKVPADFLEKLAAYGEHIGSWNPWAFADRRSRRSSCCCTGRGSRRGSRGRWSRSSRRPRSFARSIFRSRRSATASARFRLRCRDSVPLPDDEPRARCAQLLPAAISIALLGAIESLLSAVVADGMIGARHRSNTELVAQGIANIASPALRRHSRHRGDRAHRDQREERRPHADRGHRARADAARDRCTSSPARPRGFRWRRSPASCSWSPTT